MQVNDQYDVEIEKFSNLGTGITKIDGQIVFVSNACPKDKVRIKITKINKNFINADIVSITEPSQYRTNPICPLQKVCGSCQLGFIDYDYQLKLKHEIVKDTMQKIGGLNIDIEYPIASPKTKNYRQKIQYPVSQTKNSKRILAGYYRSNSHEIVNIKYCPIHPEICDEIIDFIREKALEYKISGYNEYNHTGDIRHIVIRGSEYKNELLIVLVVNSKQVGHNLKHFSESIYNKFEQVCGVCINFNSKQTNVIIGDKTECIAGRDFVEEKILDKVFKIGADTFFQINPKSAENIFKYVKDEVNKFENPTVLDAYAGIAAFGIIVSDVSKSVVSVESNKNSIEKAKEVLDENNIKNVELFAQDTTKYLKSIKKKFDIVILDPPRKGCTRESLDEALTHTKKEIIYVSCNPATLARDLKYLVSKGCKVESIQPFDMFCHTYHVENVAIIKVN